MFAGIEHFAIASPNTRRLVEWYVATLEFQVIYEYAGSYFIEASNGALIEVIPSEGEGSSHELRSPGMRHIAIAVHDFEEAYQCLQDRGVTFLDQPRESQGNWVVFFSDPDGNVLHLIRRAKPLK